MVAVFKISGFIGQKSTRNAQETYPHVHFYVIQGLGPSRASARPEDCVGNTYKRVYHHKHENQASLEV